MEAVVEGGEIAGLVTGQAVAPAAPEKAPPLEGKRMPSRAQGPDRVRQRKAAYFATVGGAARSTFSTGAGPATRRSTTGLCSLCWIFSKKTRTFS